jgi:hypothetical protein
VLLPVSELMELSGETAFPEAAEVAQTPLYLLEPVK